MLTAHRHRAHPEFPHVDAPILPGWVYDQFGEPNPTDACGVVSTGGSDLTIRRSDELVLVTVCVRDAVALAPLALQHRTTKAYEAVRTSLVAGEHHHLVRIWNFIPDIHGAMSDEIDRYMVFNAGRYTAYHDWYHGRAGFEASIATATGVGYPGANLIIHVLASDRPGTPVENPRQVQAYRYSARYGPMPPCFARATIVRSVSSKPATLLIGGTSSVHGEESMHGGDVVAQTRETLVNIAYLIVAARRASGGASRMVETVNVEAELRRIDSMRIYYARAEHVEDILRVVRPCVGHLAPHRVDFVRADICRADLLVEIEGTASID